MLLERFFEEPGGLWYGSSAHSCAVSEFKVVLGCFVLIEERMEEVNLPWSRGKSARIVTVLTCPSSASAFSRTSFVAFPKFVSATALHLLGVQVLR